MSYAEQADIEQKFGSANVAAWSGGDGSGAADATRVAAAVAYADGLIEAVFRDGAYALPLRSASGQTPALVRDWAATLAGLWLYGLRGDLENGGRGAYATMRQRVLAEMSQVRAGQRRLEATAAGSGRQPTAPQVTA